MKHACMSNCKDPEHRSKKQCCCGGHSNKGRKSKKKDHHTERTFPPPLPHEVPGEFKIYGLLDRESEE